MDDKNEYRTLKSLTIVETENRDRSAESDLSHDSQSEEAESLNFNESFAAHKYAGSFKLTYSTKQSIVVDPRGKQPTATEGISGPQPISDSAFIRDDIIVKEPEHGREEVGNEAEMQEISLTFATAEETGKNEDDNKPPLDESNKEHYAGFIEEQSGPSGDSDNVVAAIEMVEDQGHINAAQPEGSSPGGSRPNYPEAWSNGGEETLVIPQQGDEVNSQLEASSEAKHADDVLIAEQTQESKNDSFKFFAPEKEPVINPDFQERATRAVEYVVQDIIDESEGEHVKKCTGYCTDCCEFQIGTSKNSHVPQLTPEAKRANRQGFAMLQKALFPAMPKFLTDFWVLAELGITITQFVLSLISVSIENNRAFNITYIVLASVALLLALIDTFIYFVQLGSCARLVHRFYSNRKRTEVKLTEEKEKSDQDQVRPKHCQYLNPKVKSWLMQSLELLRTILSELLIYPLVVLDLFDLIVGGTYLRQTSADRINFSLFIIGTIFLVLSVYFTRSFMVITAAINIRRTPLDPSKTTTSMIGLVTQFCIHVLFQIMVHMLIIVVVGVKIHQENPDPCSDLVSSCTFVSPFLIYIIVVGGILPLYGIAVFFIINYYNLRELSIGFWVNMLALLQSESFATTVFSKKGIKESRERAKQVIEKMKYEEVKKQLKSFQSVSSWIKILYPLRFPFFVAIAALYEILLLSFVVCIAFSWDQNRAVRFVLFEEGLSSAAILLAILILIANLHVLLLVTLWIVTALAFVFLVLLQPFIWVAAALLYLPVGAILTVLGFRK